MGTLQSRPGLGLSPLGRRAERRSPQNNNDLLREAKEALSRGDSKEADQLFEEIEEEATELAAEASYQRSLISARATEYSPPT